MPVVYKIAEEIEMSEPQRESDNGEFSSEFVLFSQDNLLEQVTV